VKRFSERRPLAVAVAAVVVLALVGWLVLKTPQLFGNGRTYHAYLSDAGGLIDGNEVRVSGVDVGEVTHLAIRGARIEVTFTVDRSVHVGADSRADVDVLSPLGNEYLSVTPKGTASLTEPIGLDHTSVPKTLVQTFNQAGNVVGKIDTQQLSAAIADAGLVAGTSAAQTHTALAAISQLATSLAQHQQQLQTLLQYGTQITQVLNARRADIVAVMGQADQVIQVIDARRQAIANLLTSTTDLSQHLSAILSTNKTELTPLIANLQQVSAVLSKDSASLATIVPDLAAFDRYTANATGNGLYTDLLSPTLLIPDNLVAQCGTSAGCAQ
jgi:phospholipid/cholesterol/gamma-HCH transport system substrate-binding protein